MTKLLSKLFSHNAWSKKARSGHYIPGGPSCIVVVSLYYQWPIYVSMFGNSLSNLSGNKRLLVATSVFRNEPYGPAGTC